MTLNTRRFLLYLFIVVFAVGGTIIVASSVGFVFNIFDGSVSRTGGIFIKSSTPRISIRVDGEFQKETSRLTGGALLTNITPGEHIIRIEKEEYHPWSKGISVAPMLVTELRNILLIAASNAAATSTIEEIALLTATTTPLYSATLKSDGTLTKTVTTDSGEAGTTTLTTDTNSFDIIDDFILVVQQNGFLTKINIESGVLQTIDRPGFYLSDTVPLRFIPSPSGEVALIDASGGLLLLDRNEKLIPISGGVKSVVFDSEGKKLLVIKENSLEIIWREDNPYQPFQDAGERETIITLATPIHEAQWFYRDNAHIIFRADEGIFITEIDGRGGKNTVELISGAVDEIKTMPEIPDTVFFRRDKNYFTIEL